MVGVQTREATDSVLRAVHQPPWVEALKILLCRSELREGKQFPQGCPVNPCRLLGLLGLLGLPLMLCDQPHCLVFTSLTGTQERGRLQVLGRYAVLFTQQSWEGPRPVEPEKVLGRQVPHVASLHLTLTVSPQYSSLNVPSCVCWVVIVYPAKGPSAESRRNRKCLGMLCCRF